MLVVAAGAMAPETSVAGQQGEDPDENAAISFVPGIAFVDVASGTTERVRVVVKNQTRTGVRFDVAVDDMTHGSGDGAIREFAFVEPGAAPYGAGRWLAPAPSEFVLRGGEEREVEAVIDVPDRAGAGGRYAALRFTARALDDDAELEFRSVTWVPILLTIAGDAERDLAVRLDPAKRLHWSGGTIRWDLHLRNDGNVHEVVNSELSVDPMLDAPAVARMQPVVLLPGEERTIGVSLPVRSAPDSWIATATVDRAGADAIEAAASREWLLPWWFLVGTIVLVVVVTWRVRARA